MCIIASKPAGVEMPSDIYLNNMFNSNPDGAGLMYAWNGKVYIEKGFMNKEDFFKRLRKLSEEYNMTELPMVMHFRITTHGGTKPDNCHPFPISDSMGMLKKTKCKTDVGVAHNGIISVTPRNKEISDTMEYIAGQLAPLKRAVRYFYKSKDLMQMIHHAIDSKMVIMDESGNMYYIGDFWEEKGVKYSNTSYKYDAYCFREFPYNADAWYEEDGMYELKYLMWLDGTKGEYVKVKNGELYDGDDFAIDNKNNVYYFDMEAGMFVRIYHAEALKDNGTALRYDKKSKNICRELIMKEEYYE